MGVNIILSMKKEDKEKKDEFLERLDSLLTKYKYKVSSRNNQKLIADITCWYNDENELVYNNDKEINKYLGQIDDATNYRSSVYQDFIENVNINHIAFDVCDKMKYNSVTLKKIYEKIREINQNESDDQLKDILFEDVFHLCVEYEASLEIRITTEYEMEEERLKEEIARGGMDTVKREFPENKVLKMYQLKVKSEDEKVFKNKLYKILMKYKYYVNQLSEIFDFSKWFHSKNGSNTYIMKKLKYYFDDMIDDDNKRVQLFLLHRNTPFNKHTTYYDHVGMGYGKEEISKALILAQEDKNTFYVKLFELLIEYDIIIEIQ